MIRLISVLIPLLLLLPSARAGEGLIRLLMLDPGLWRQMNGITGAEFSSPLLGRAFDRLVRRAEEGLSTQLAALAGDFSNEEMDHLAQVAGQPESVAGSGRSIENYIAIIQMEREKKQALEQDDALLAAQKRYQQKKAYMEEKQ